MSRRNRDKTLAESYTKEQVKQAHDTALKAFIEANGVITATTLCRRAHVPTSWITRWIREEDWNQFLPGMDPGDKMSLSDKARQGAREAGKRLGLTEQEWKFCYSYYKCRSAAQAAMNAGYSKADHYPAQLLKRPEIRKAIDLVCEEVRHEALVEAVDVVNMWAKIAFADMTDYITITRGGVVLKPGATIDGQVITEVKEGRDGITIKLADRMKALDRLAEYLKMTPDSKMKLAKQILMEKAALNENEDHELTVQILGV